MKKKVECGSNQLESTRERLGTGQGNPRVSIETQYDHGKHISVGEEYLYYKSPYIPLILPHSP